MGSDSRGEKRTGWVRMGRWWRCPVPCGAAAGRGAAGPGGGALLSTAADEEPRIFCIFQLGPSGTFGLLPGYAAGPKAAPEMGGGCRSFLFFFGGGGGRRGGWERGRGGEREEREGGKGRRAEKEVAGWGRNPALGYGRRKFPLAGVAQGARRGVGAGWSPFVCAGACGARGPSCPGFFIQVSLRSPRAATELRQL